MAKKTGTPFSDVPVLCLFLVAAARAAVGAVTAAGGFSFFLILDHRPDDEANDGHKGQSNNDCSHKIISFPKDPETVVRLRVREVKPLR